MSNTKYQRSIFTSKFNETFDITLTLPYLYFVYEVMLIYIHTHTGRPTWKHYTVFLPTSALIYLHINCINTFNLN